MTKFTLSCLLLLYSITFHAQQIIAYQGFRNSPGYIYGNGTSSLQTGNTTLGDSWSYTCINTNGQSAIVSSPSFQTVNSLEVVNWWDNKAQIIFNEVDLTGYSNVTFSIGYQLDGRFDAGEYFNVQYEYRIGTTWYSNTFTKSGVNSTTDLQNFGTGTNNPFTFNVPIGANRFRARVYTYNTSATDPNNGNAYQEERFFIDDVKLTAPYNAPEIQVFNNFEIFDNAVTTSSTNNTDFGTYDINSGAKNRTYTIKNIGDQNLIILPVTLTGSLAFTVTSQPLSLLAPGSQTTFTIAFDPAAVGNYSATVSFSNNDPNENPFNFLIEGEGVKIYPDTDGDGISDNIDIDDDNDGIRDSIEQLNCLSSPNSNVVENLFLFEDFGSGLNRVRIDGTTSGVTTTYCYEDGTTAMAPDECDNNVDLNDGKYTVHYSITDGVMPSDISSTGPDIASYAEWAWTTVKDHTPGDTNGRMAIFNASFTPGVFYETEITGILPDVPITYSFWAMNIDNPDSSFPAAGLPRILPNITVNFYTTDHATLLATYSTGDISRCSAPGNTCPQSEWKLFSTSITLPINEFIIQFVNNAPGGSGNDLALDDIKITQTLCDVDRDGIADVIDLDNDNDGIPNIVEAAMIPNPDPDEDATTKGSTWVDLNNNGMNDLFESATAVDSDGDGVPDYLDLDSDNDTIFDALEFDGLGDIDISGDGVGNGTDVDSGIPNDEFDGDGILGIADTNDSDTNANDHGTNGYLGAIDTDGDGTPDYLDVFNNVTGVYDIDTTFFSNLDANNDGVIDDTNDDDFDGIMNSFDTNDTYFGSPRDMSDKYSLHFDGRNDYIEDSGDIILGQSQVTMMAWVKIDNSFNSTGVVVGQDNFYIRVLNTTRPSVRFNGANYNLTGASNNLPPNIWTHIAAVFDGVNSRMKLYVNGELKLNSAAGTVVNNSTNKLFRIGSLPTTANGNYFLGEIDEVRVFNTALTDEQLQKIVFQEMNDTNFAQGKIIPLNIPGLNASNLIRYYRMDTFKDDIVDNLVSPSIDLVTGAKLYNIKSITRQTAPMPYETITDGAWTNGTVWKHGNLWDISELTNLKPWSIVKIQNNITTSNNIENAGLIINPGSKLSVEGDLQLRNNWYLKLDGTIDLQNRSQLLQTDSSILDATSSGKIERDQQGVANLFNYNYWSSPVSTTNNISVNSGFSIAEVMKDGTNPLMPVSINFVGGYNGSQTTPISIAKYWLYKFQNVSNNYANWSAVTPSSIIETGQGFTMKGVVNNLSGATQNYTFIGKPNNGTITIPISANNLNLTGNPYPSSLDSQQFILDNIDGGNLGSSNAISGTLYFWQHATENNSHYLASYLGGYATLNLVGGVPPMTASPLNAGLGTAAKIPNRHIPVGQGFFIKGDETGGNITFKNSQRAFVLETDASATGSNTMFKTSNVAQATQQIGDTLSQFKKIRLIYQSATAHEKQILLGFMNEYASDAIEKGFDAEGIDNTPSDFYFAVVDKKLVIQGVGHFNAQNQYPITIKNQTQGNVIVQVKEIENFIDPVNIYIHDNETDTYYDILNNSMQLNLAAGTIENRFSLVFQNAQALSNNDFETIENEFMVFINNDILTINTTNKTQNLVQFEMYSLTGQKVLESKLDNSSNEYNVSNLSTGTYIVKVKTTTGSFSKKVIKN